MYNSNTANKAEREFEILCNYYKDPDNRPIVEEFKDEMLALVEKFGNSGQSGGSAPYVAGAICSALKKLFMHEPLLGITGEESEWNNISEMMNDCRFQNNRCSAVFKEGVDGKPYYIDAIIKRTQKDHCFSGCSYLTEQDAMEQNNQKINSRGIIKKFPFEPKTFYIDVIEKEIAPDDWIMWIKDQSQLDEVLEYYDIKNLVKTENGFKIVESVA